MDYTLSLPEEIVLYIMKFLAPDELFICMGVCKRWRDFLNIDSVWKPIAQKLRIHGVNKDSDIGPMKLSYWADAFYQFACVPSVNWRNENYEFFTLEKDFEDECVYTKDGNCFAIYFYTKATINIYTIYKDLVLTDEIIVPLPLEEEILRYTYTEKADIALYLPFLVVCRFNKVVLYKKTENSKFFLLKKMTVNEINLGKNETIDFRSNLSCEIGWDAIWFSGSSLKKSYRFDLNESTYKVVNGRFHFLLYSEARTVIVWCMNYIKTLSVKGDEKYTIERKKIKCVDFNSSKITLKFENNIEILNLSNGEILFNIKLENDKIDFLLSDCLYLLKKSKHSTLTALSLKNFKITWSINIVNGLSFDVSTIGLRYLLVLPKNKTEHYFIYDKKGELIKECHLPKFMYTPMGDATSCWISDEEDRFKMMSFL